MICQAPSSDQNISRISHVAIFLFSKNYLKTCTLFEALSQQKTSDLAFKLVLLITKKLKGVRIGRWQ